MCYEFAPLGKKFGIIDQTHGGGGGRYAIFIHVLMEYTGGSNTSIFTFATGALDIGDVAEIIGRCFLPNLYVDFRLHVGIIGYLIVLTSRESIVFKILPGEDVVDIAALLNEVFYGDVGGKEAADVHLALGSEKDIEYRAACDRGIKALQQLNVPKCVRQACVFNIFQEVFKRTQVCLLDVVVEL